MIQNSYANENKKQWLMVLIGSILLVLLFLFGPGRKLLNLNQFMPGGEKLSVNTTTPESVLEQNSQFEEPILQHNEEPSQALLQETKGMPEDVRNWLEHLRKIEKKRKSMASKHVANVTLALASMNSKRMTGLLDDIFSDDPGAMPEPDTSALDDLKVKTEEKKKEWQTLRSEFMSYPPPAECLTIQSNYNQALGETSSMITEILDAVVNSQDDPESAIALLTTMQGTSGERIDEYAVATDEGVQEVCDKYEVRKWFSVSGDVGGGILGKLGLGF